MAPRGDGENEEDGGFLTRWSRRKREALAEKEQSKAGAGNATGPLPRLRWGRVRDGGRTTG